MQKLSSKITENIIIATGSSPKIPNILSIEESFRQGYAVTSTEFLYPTGIPKHLVIGAGTISIEFATLCNALGTPIHTIE